MDGLLALPKFGTFRHSEDDTDFNDLYVLASLDTVKQQIDAASEPSEDHEGEEDADSEGEEESADEKQADVLVRLAPQAGLFHCNDDGNGYADITVNGHRETWSIKSEGFKRWLVGEFYRATKSAPNSATLNAALAVIGAKAEYDGENRAVHLRVAAHHGRIYLDLSRRVWQVVEIEDSGWRLTDNARYALFAARYAGAAGA